jgi:uncharacterized membrane protein
MRRFRHAILLPMVALLAAECATAACPLASSECLGVLRDVSQLGAHLDRLSRGERILSVQDVVAADGEPTTQVAGSAVVAAPPDAVWSVLTDFGSWPGFVPNLESVDVASDASSPGAVLLRQHTRVWGLGFSATTRRVLDAERRILWDQLVPGAGGDVRTMSGFWQVLDLGDGRSLLRFQSRIALAARLPGMVESWLIERGAPGALAAFAAEIERRQAS